MSFFQFLFVLHKACVKNRRFTKESLTCIKFRLKERRKILLPIIVYRCQECKYVALQDSMPETTFIYM